MQLTRIEQLESRRLLSASLDDGALVVIGTTADDRLTISRTVDDVAVNLNGTEQRFKLSQVNIVYVKLGVGADEAILGKLPFRAEIQGGRGNDTLSGGANNDSLFGQGGDDYLFGAGGNDYLDGGGESDDMLGGEGTRDMLDYSARTNDLHVDISTDDEDDGESGEHDSVFTDVEIVIGGSGDDDISDKSGKSTTLIGGAGDDTLTGGAGRNTFDGGRGNDVAWGFGNNDVFWFEDGQGDTLHGGSGEDAADVDNAFDVADGMERNL